VVFTWEIPVDRTGAQTCFLADVLDGGLMEPLP
jgi:hypothetical protein